MIIQNAVAVFFGGAFGALFRFLVSEFLPLSKWGIPLTIILVNFIGCFLMGAADSLFEQYTPDSRVRHFLIVGLLGGFTTFSTFSLEFSGLIKQGGFVNAFIYLFMSVFMALAGFFTGYLLVKTIK